MKTSELTDLALDWAVAKCKGKIVTGSNGQYLLTSERNMPYHPTTNWEQGGPIIEQEKIWLTQCDGMWASRDGHYSRTATTPLIAAMRCYVASKLGDVVEVPEELK